MPSLTQTFPKKRRRDGDGSIGGDIHLALYVWAAHHPSPCPSPWRPHQLADRLDSSHSTQDFHHGCYPYQEAAHHHHHHHHLNNPSPKKHMGVPSPPAKKLRISTPGGGESPDPTREGGAAVPRRQHAALGPSSRYYNHQHTTSRHSPSSKTTTNPAATTTNLSPCHVCHRKPTKRTELDSYADCEGCGERTCYVCIRECLGWWKDAPTPGAHPLDYDEALMQDDGADDENVHDGKDIDDNRRRMDEERNADESWGHGVQDQSLVMEDAPPSLRGKALIDHQMRRGGTTWGKGGGRGHRRRICSQCCVEEGPEGEAVCLGCLGT